MGSGQEIVDPFFGLLNRTLFRGDRPRLREGVFAALWALRHAIALNAGGINGPPQIGVLHRPAPDTALAARLLSDDELAESGNIVTAAEDHLNAFRDTFRDMLAPSPSTTRAAPESPPPPPPGPV
jgi:hypothetical protein